ncbi:MAG: hypothetical protein JXB42_04375 [Deltaproteobacteria bacterium]|nr:hypothetical protein [Deltaproteobacteria bacterium]
MKKEIISAILVSFMFFGTAQARILGDFNNDGNLTIADAIAFIRVLMKIDPAGDIGQEYLPASEGQAVQSDLVGDWEKPETEDGVIYTHVTTINSNGTFWEFCLIDETQVYEHGWGMGTYSVSGNMLTINFIVEPHRYNAGNSTTVAYSVSGDSLMCYNEQGNVADVLTRRN